MRYARKICIFSTDSYERYNSIDGDVYMHSAFSDEHRHRRLELDSTPLSQLFGDL
jgi:hypothetical protein